MNKKEINSSSANAQSNGWTFQYVAALVVFLENMGLAKQFCVEGTEDIVVILKNNEKICAQAKSGLDQDAIVSPHFDRIMASIETLSINSDAIQLISVSNFHKPLGDDDAFSYMQFLDKKNFENLTTETQNKIRQNSKEKGYVLDFDKFKLWFVRFEGAEPEQGLAEYLNRKLHRIDPGQYFPVDDLMEKWLNIIKLNARDKVKNIETDIICGTLFGKVLNSTKLSQITNLIDVEIDPCYEEDFERFFKTYFARNSQIFTTYTLIVSDFLSFVNETRPSRTEQYRLFVEEYCKPENIPLDIKSFFNEYSEKEQLSLEFYKLFIAYVCYKRNVVKAIREVFGYEDN